MQRAYSAQPQTVSSHPRAAAVSSGGATVMRTSDQHGAVAYGTMSGSVSARGPGSTTTTVLQQQQQQNAIFAPSPRFAQPQQLQYQQAQQVHQTQQVPQAPQYQQTQQVQQAQQYQQTQQYQQAQQIQQAQQYQQTQQIQQAQQYQQVQPSPRLYTSQPTAGPQIQPTQYATAQQTKPGQIANAQNLTTSAPIQSSAVTVDQKRLSLRSEHPFIQGTTFPPATNSPSTYTTGTAHAAPPSNAAAQSTSQSTPQARVVARPGSPTNLTAQSPRIVTGSNTAGKATPTPIPSATPITSPNTLANAATPVPSSGPTNPGSAPAPAQASRLSSKGLEPPIEVITTPQQTASSLTNTTSLSTQPSQESIVPEPRINARYKQRLIHREQMEQNRLESEVQQRLITSSVHDLLQRTAEFRAKDQRRQQDEKLMLSEIHASQLAVPIQKTAANAN